MASKLGFSWRIKFEKAWYYVDPKNGSVSGAFGSVMNNVSELSIGHGTPNEFEFTIAGGLHSMAWRGSSIPT